MMSLFYLACLAVFVSDEWDAIKKAFKDCEE
jgi:hypothetical protein